MADKAAKIQLAVEGADQAVSAVERVKSSLRDMGTAGSAVSTIVGSVASSLGQLGQDAVRLVSAVNAINLAGKVEEVRALDLAIQRLSTAGGGSVGELNGVFTATSKAINQSEIALQQYAATLGKATYDFKSAAEAQKGLGEQGLFTGRSQGEMQALGQSLYYVFGVAGDTTAALGKLNAMAAALGTNGGPAALTDQLVAMQGALRGAVSNQPGSRESAFVATQQITKGMAPDAAASVGASVLQGLQGDYFDINYTLGYDILDANGQVNDPAKVLRDLNAAAKKRGLGLAQRRQAFRSKFGAVAGSRVFTALEQGDLDDDAINAIMGVDPSSAAGDAARAYQGSDAGAAEAARLERDRNQREVARPVASAQDALVDMFKYNPLLGAGVSAGGGAGLLSLFRGLSAFGGGGGGGAAAGGEAVGEMSAWAAYDAVNGGLVGGSLALPLAAVLAGIGAQGAVLGDIGGDRDEMGANWRKGRNTQGETLQEIAARQAREKAASNGYTKYASDYEGIRKAVEAGGGDPAATYRAMSPNLRWHVSENPDLQQYANALINGTGDDDKIKKAGEEQARALRAGGPLPVYVVAAPAPVAAH